MVIGPNGAGKSLFLAQLARILNTLNETTGTQQVSTFDAFPSYENSTYELKQRQPSVPRLSRGDWLILSPSNQEISEFWTGIIGPSAKDAIAQSLEEYLRLQLLPPLEPDSPGIDRLAGNTSPEGVNLLIEAMKADSSITEILGALAEELLKHTEFGITRNPNEMAAVFVRPSARLRALLDNLYEPVEYDLRLAAQRAAARFQKLVFGDGDLYLIGYTKHKILRRVQVHPTLVPDSTSVPDVNLDEMVMQYANAISDHICLDRRLRTSWLYEPHQGLTQIVPKRHQLTGEYSIDRSVLLACKVLSKLVNENLPDFITSKYYVDIAPISPFFWHESNRVFAYLRLQETRSLLDNFPVIDDVDAQDALKETSSGVRRWIASVISMFNGAQDSLIVNTDRLFARLESEIDETAAFEDMQTKDLGEIALEYFDIDDQDRLTEEYFRCCRDSPSLVDVGFDYSNRVILVDEPEANLHPSAVNSIVRWLQDRSAQAKMVVVATHNQNIFDSQYADCGRYVMGSQSVEGGRFTELTKDVSYSNLELENLGITPGELLLSVKRWICVEGVVDKIVIEGLFRHRLEATGTHVLPLHGSGNASMTFQAPLLNAVSGDLVILLDSPAPDGTSIEGEAIRRMVDQDLKSVNSHGHGRKIVQLKAVDIMFYIDPVAICEVTRNLKKPLLSWAAAWEEFLARQMDLGGKRTVKEFKRYLSEHYGILIDAQTASRAVAIQSQRDSIPLQLEDLIFEITDPLFML